MSDSSLATAASGETSAAPSNQYGGCISDQQSAWSLNSKTATEPIRTRQSDAYAEELDQLLAHELEDSRPIDRKFRDREITEGARDGTTQRRSQEDRFYLHRLQIYGRPVEFAVSLQATTECKPSTILRLLKQSHVLDPGCQRGRRLYVLVHRSVPLLTRR